MKMMPAFLIKSVKPQKVSRSLFLFFLFSCFTNSILAQIKSGPMLGYKAMREVAVWVQLEEAQKINFNYSTADQSQKWSKEYESTSENANCLHLIADGLEVGTEYNYQILDEAGKLLSEGKFSTQQLWQYRTDPPAFSFVIGSCTYTNEEKYDRPGKPYGQEMSIFDVINKTDAEAMLWLGDNIYLREADWDTKTGIYHRYTHFKSQEALQELWKNMHHYAIWDDHDYGPNDGDRSFINKGLTRAAFKDFWANPNYGFYDKENTIAGMFSYNDADFFLMDNRSFRSPNNRVSGEREILGDDQINWLIDALVGSKAKFKFVAIGGQVLNPAALYENHSTFAAEREKLIRLIDQEKIKNVIFLSGDRHKTELTKSKTENGIVIYDFTSSPLTSTSYNSIDEGNYLRVEGTHFAKQNFGMLNFSGSWKERQLILQTYDASGKIVWEHVVTPQ